MKKTIENAVADLLGIALSYPTKHVGAQAAQAASELSGCLARHTFSDVPEAELWEVQTGPDLCEFLQHQTVLAHYALVAKYQSNHKTGLYTAPFLVYSS